MIHFLPPEKDYFYTSKRNEKMRHLRNLTIEHIKKKVLLAINIFITLLLL